LRVSTNHFTTLPSIKAPLSSFPALLKQHILKKSSPLIALVSANHPSKKWLLIRETSQSALFHSN
jgi:hypothetical protein